jgi:hypothetical protein
MEGVSFSVWNGGSIIGRKGVERQGSGLVCGGGDIVGNELGEWRGECVSC